jgi:serine/threonine protein kinase
MLFPWSLCQSTGEYAHDFCCSMRFLLPSSTITSSLVEKQWMSPEQQSRPEDELSTGKLNEKIDIYALGNIFYKIAVGNSPWKVSEQCSSLCVCYDAPLLISCTLSTVDSMITKSRKSPTTKRVKLPVPNYVEPSPRYRRKYETPPAP